MMEMVWLIILNPQLNLIVMVTAAQIISILIVIMMVFLMQLKEEMENLIRMAMVSLIVMTQDMLMQMVMECQIIQNLPLNLIMMEMVAQITQIQTLIMMVFSMQLKVEMENLTRMAIGLLIVQIPDIPMQMEMVCQTIQSQLQSLILMVMVIQITQIQTLIMMVFSMQLRAEMENLTPTETE